ncbi:MAG: endolytic transglycosylase MltG [Micropruina sp.]|uniref:endolytic transglycosylase MltG n=1 Tax=Micropruina sp. TaxID=2737536 RepID=UPI0039E46CE7
MGNLLRELRDPETGRWLPKEVWYRVRGAIAVLLSLGVLVGGGWFVYGKVQEAWLAYRTVDDYIDPAGVADVMVEIPQGSTTNKIADILLAANVIRTAKAFDRAAAADPDVRKIQYGLYKLRTQIPGKTALQMLLDPANQVKNQFQIREGLRLSEVITSLAATTKVSEKDLNAVLKDRKSLGLPSWIGKSNEGFIFPDTYDLPLKPTAASVLKLPINQFKKTLQDLAFEERASVLGYKPYDVLIIASIIEREVFRDDDRAKVARVFYNRLKQGMPLQSDATVAYSVNKTGTIWTSDADRGKKNTSPYNTYQRKGLPPGPITAPAKKAMEAALSPADGDWLYFVPINLDTGETVFSDNYPDQKKAEAQLKQWCLASPANRKKCA